MRLKELRIRLNRYDFQGPIGKYSGEIEFTNTVGDIKINLDAEASQRVLEVIADELVETSKTLSKQLTAAVIEQADSVPQLEGAAGTG